MTSDFSGWLWVVVDVLAVVILAGAMIYGGRMWAHRRRDPATLRAQEQATRELYSRERSDVGDRPAPGSRAASR
jgi:hypothetical protein